MNNDLANKHIKRIRDMVKAQCEIEITPGEMDSVHLTFVGKGKRIPIGWTGTQLETIIDDDLWRELEIKTQGLVKKPN